VPGGGKILATVNGVAITDRDVEHRSKRGLMGGGPGHEATGNVLQTVIRDEIVYQKALQLGLDRDEEYQLKLGDLQAQVRAFQRQEMASRFRRHVQEQAEVTDADAREYFEKNANLIQTRFHVFQIFYRGKYPEILEDHRAVKSGTPFEEVAWRRFAGMPRSGTPPWDLGELFWFQLPPAWRGIVDRLEPGQVSDVITGESERYWVIKVAGKRNDPAITFDTEKERIRDAMRQSKADELHARTLEELKAKATVVYTK
jgi:parvulin-like peptidyl-prolyl isomerase